MLVPAVIDSIGGRLATSNSGFPPPDPLRAAMSRWILIDVWVRRSPRRGSTASASASCRAAVFVAPGPRLRRDQR